MTRHPAYQKGGFHPQLVKCDSKGCLWFKLHTECFNVENDCYFCVCYIPPDNSPVYKNVNSEHFEYDLFQILNDEIVTYSCVCFLGFLAFDLCRFYVIICFFYPRHNGQWPPTSKDFYTRSYPLDYFLILLFEKEPVFPFWMLSAKQGNYWYHIVIRVMYVNVEAKL